MTSSFCTCIGLESLRCITVIIVANATEVSDKPPRTDPSTIPVEKIDDNATTIIIVEYYSDRLPKRAHTVGLKLYYFKHERLYYYCKTDKMLDTRKGYKKYDTM